MITISAHIKPDELENISQYRNGNKNKVVIKEQFGFTKTECIINVSSEEVTDSISVNAKIGVWQFLEVVYDEGSRDIYLDGIHIDRKVLEE